MKEKKTDLVVPVDFKMYSLKSIDYAKKLNAKIGGKIHLLHVIESQPWWEGGFSANSLEKTAKEKLTVIKREEQLPEDTEVAVVQGKRHRDINAYATKINARYIILADNYPQTESIHKLGSTLSQIITTAEQPVISITNKEDRIFNNIAVPIDLSQQTRLKLYKSVALALNHNATIHLVSVLFNKRKLQSSRLQQKIEQYKKTYEENGINYKVKLLVKEEDLAYKEIIKYCESNNIDTILMMTHKETASFDNYLGAFAQHVINSATMPVVTINKASASTWETKLSTLIVDPFGIFGRK